MINKIKKMLGLKKKEISFEEQKRQTRQAMKNWEDLVNGKYGKEGSILAKNMIEIELNKTQEEKE